ncbi:S9 family peptidase [Granulicoccus phenolivorans]|uniref:S9 family peptidase n=1 Tax=Granulicoccus phenolivorans TaxID=266854 RepID=UPI000422EF49|nr:S9 family peptidase [Granulicoccus phenolivorans]
MSEQPLSQPPIAARRPSPRTHHGDTFLDAYEWLRDQAAPETLAYLRAENAWTEQQTAGLAPLTEELFADMQARTQETDLSVPSHTTHPSSSGSATSWWYYTRTVTGQEYEIHCRVQAPADRMPEVTAGTPVPGEEIMLDENVLAEGQEFFSLGAFAVSPNGRLLAYAVDLTGGERFTLYFRDLTTGALLPESVDDITYGIAWAGNEHLLYARADESWRPHQVLRHRLGTAADADPVIFTEPDERFWLYLDNSRDDRFVVLSSASKLTGECHLLDCADPTGEFRLVAPRRDGVEYSVEVAGDRLLILHNRDGADFALAQAPLEATGDAEWTPVLPHRPGVRLTGVDAYAGQVVVQLRRDGLTGIHLIPRDSAGDLGTGTDLTFDEPLYAVSARGEWDWDTDTIRLDFTSLVTPPTLLEHDLRTGARRVLKRRPVLDHPVHGPYRSEDYVQTRTWATAEDGTRVPISLVHRREVPLDGSAPALLYGYGSYEISIDPTFSTMRLSLLDRGFVYAIAHVRGGGELGRAWYEQGNRLHKRNSFTDFIACAHHLVAEGYTAPDRLVAEGGSAGGLLMGAVANLAPEAFAGIHASVPFVDALTTILDPSLPLTVTEWEEWGDPLHDPEVYAYMRGYSPYENVTEQRYPAILATTSLNDTRVLYVEPAKWIAALRHSARVDPSRLLLRTEMVAGHGGVTGRHAGWREAAFEYAWLIDAATRSRHPVTEA